MGRSTPTDARGELWPGVFGQHTHPDGPGGQALQDRMPVEEPQDPWCADRSVAGQDPAEHPRLDLSLHQLGDHGGQQPAPADPAEAEREPVSYTHLTLPTTPYV